jgi:hypothetical protein
MLFSLLAIKTFINQISCTAVSSLLAFPPISYMHSSPPTFVLHALPISSSSIGDIENRSLKGKGNMQNSHLYPATSTR